MKKFIFRGSLGKIKLMLGVLRCFFNIEMLQVQKYKNSYYLQKIFYLIFTLMNKFKIQLKQKEGGFLHFFP